MRRIEIKDYNKNFFTEINYTWGIVTAGNKDTGFNGMTVSWGGIGVIWNKYVAYLFVRKSRYTHDFLEKSDNVSLSFISDEYKDAKVVFGRKSGRDIEKFSETNLTAKYDEVTNCYYVGESDTVFLLKKVYKAPISFDGMNEEVLNRFYPDRDMHDMYVCEIIGILEKE